MKSRKSFLIFIILFSISLPLFAHNESLLKQDLFSCPITDSWLAYEKEESSLQKLEILSFLNQQVSEHNNMTPIIQLQSQQQEIFLTLENSIQQLLEILQNIDSLSSQSKLQTQLENKITALLFEHLEFEKTVSDYKSDQIWKLTYSLLIILFIFISATIFLIFIYNNTRHRAQKDNLFTNQMLQVQEEERARISRELHDTVTQDLRTGLLFIHELSEKITDTSSDEYELISKIDLLQSQNLKTIRNIIQNLTPPEIESSNLKNLLTDYCGTVMQMTHLRCTFYAEDNLDFSKFNSIQKLNIFRIVQEAITNSIKHSNATEINILVRSDRENTKKMIFFISDDGCGFNPENVTKQNQSFVASIDPLKTSTNLGINGMKNRARILNADLEILSDEECGTEIRLKV